MSDTSAAAMNPELDTVLADLQLAESKDHYLDQVFQIFDIYGLGHGCLHTFGQRYSSSEALWRVTPGDVTLACSQLIAKNKHPALRLGRNRHFAFDMFEFRDQFDGDPDVEALFQAFEANGLKHAYGLPINTRDHGSYVFVIARPGDKIETVELLTLQAICTNAINGVKQFEARPCDSAKSSILSDSERNLLISVAKGHTTTDISANMQLSESTVQIMLNNVVSKLSSQNISHAIVLALIEGEIGLSDCQPDS